MASELHIDRYTSEMRKIYSVPNNSYRFVQLVRVTSVAARFSIFLLDMLAKLQGDTEISTILKFSPISK